MKRKIVHWRWEDPDAQQSFAEWVGFPDRAQTAQEIDQIETLLVLRPPLRVLDVGCGTGRQAIELARRGYHVVGIDVASPYLEQARAQAREAGVQVAFRLQRGADLLECEAYDLVLAFNHTLGFMEADELAEHMARIRQALVPGGTFLLHLAGPRRVPGAESAPAAESSPSKNWAEQEGRFVLTEKRFEEGYRIEDCIVIDTEASEIIEYHERQRAFSLEEVIALLEGAGLAPIQCLADLAGAPATADRFGTFVCRKVDP